MPKLSLITFIKIFFQPPPHKYSLLPRFYRAQAIHELLWMLVYGDDSQQEISDEDNDSQANSDLEESLDRSDNWMKCLKPLAKVCNDDGTPLRGWFRFSDVLSVLPVSILCRTIDIAGEVSTCSACGLDGLGNNTNSYKVSNNYCLKWFSKLKNSVRSLNHPNSCISF